jgi:hypothetical protein
MKALKLITILAAAGASAAAASDASAVDCYSPALGYFADVIRVGNLTNPVYLACSTRSAAGVVNRVKASGSANSTNHTISVNLIEGDYARVGAYNSNRQGINCFVEDFSPANSGQGVNCGQYIAYIDISASNN